MENNYRHKCFVIRKPGGERIYLFITNATVVHHEEKFYQLTDSELEMLTDEEKHALENIQNKIGRPSYDSLWLEGIFVTDSRCTKRIMGNSMRTTIIRFNEEGWKEISVDEFKSVYKKVTDEILNTKPDKVHELCGKIITDDYDFMKVISVDKNIAYGIVANHSEECLELNGYDISSGYTETTEEVFENEVYCVRHMFDTMMK